MSFFPPEDECESCSSKVSKCLFCSFDASEGRKREFSSSSSSCSCSRNACQRSFLPLVPLLPLQTSLRQPLPSAPCTRRSGRKAIRWVNRSLCLRGTGTWPGWRKWKPGTERNIPQEAAEPSTARRRLADWVAGGRGRHLKATTQTNTHF